MPYPPYNRGIVKIIDSIKNKYRYSLILLKQLVITDFKLRYKGSALGYVWTLLKPLALFAILYVVFVHFLQMGKDIPHFAVYLLLGIVMWNYFTEVTMNGLSAIVGRGDLMRKLSFPRYTIVVAGSFSALINLTINLLVVGVFMIMNGVVLTWSALMIIPIILQLFIFALAVALLLSALYVKFRDVNYIWEVVLQAGFYATPIIYPIQLVIAKSTLAAQVIILNPMAQMIQDARHFLVTPDAIRITDLHGSPFIYLVPIGITIGITIVAILYFKRKSPGFAEEI